MSILDIILIVIPAVLILIGIPLYEANRGVYLNKIYWVLVFSYLLTVILLLAT